MQAVVKANSKVNGKGQISTPCGSETPERILLKPRIYNYMLGHDYTRKSMRRCDNVGGLDKCMTCHTFWFLRSTIFLYSWDRAATVGWIFTICTTCLYTRMHLLSLHKDAPFGGYVAPHLGGQVLAFTFMTSH